MGTENQDISELKKQMKEGKSNILVAVRVRPLSKSEMYISKFETVVIEDNKKIYMTDPQFEMSPEDVRSFHLGSPRQPQQE
jgi:kinesin family protein 18/19